MEKVFLRQYQETLTMEIGFKTEEMDTEYQQNNPVRNTKVTGKMTNTMEKEL